MHPSIELAEHAFAVLQHRFAVAAGPARNRGLFHERARGRSRRRALAFNWSFANAFAAAIDLHGLGRGPTRREIDHLLTGLSRYWDTRRRTGVAAYSSTVVRPLRRSGKYFDDNAWSGLNLMRLGRVDPTRRELLAQARCVFDFVHDEQRRRLSVSDSRDCAPGGIHWQQQIGRASPEIGTVANAASAQLALRLYEATTEEMYLDVALALYAWVNAHMRDPGNALFWDHVTPPHCRVDTTQWSYNQGLMIGTNVLLFRATADPKYRQEAVAIADAALGVFDLARLSTEPVEFAVILFRNLLLLSTVAKDQWLPERTHRIASQYLQSIWPRFIGGLGDAPSRRATLIEHAAIVQMIALRCWPAERYDQLV